MHRLFAGLAVPDTIAERLLPLKSDIPGAKWRRRDHFHITLCFFGEVDRDVAEELAAGLETLQARALTLQLDGVGWFGRREPRAVYARIAEEPALSDLAKACRRQAARLGLKLGQDPFRPHITLAYCNQSPLDQVRAWSETYQMLRSAPFMVDQFHLYESFTSPKRQSQYVSQADYHLS